MPARAVAFVCGVIVQVGLVLAACGRGRPVSQLDLDAIRVSAGARMRTDAVGDGAFASTATFVLVDAENTAAQGAYVTLGGELKDAAGATVGELKLQSLWVPAREARTFALVDSQRAARPTAAAARITVTGAMIPSEPPRAQITELHSFDDRGKTVVQAYVVNAADRPGQAMVIGAFHDASGEPMTRPFQMIELPAHDRRVVQFVGPAGSTRGTIFIGELIY